IAGVTAVAPQAQASATAIYEGANWQTTINGTTNAYFEVQAWPLTAGRYWTPQEQSAGKAVCIIGSTVYQNLWHGGQAVGTRFRIGSISCDVIGVLSTRGQAGFGGDQDDVVIMPIKTVQRRFTGNQDIRLMLVGVDQAYATSTVQASIT
ncbi:ABC transporter permease, partial [Escherichia coli]|nr:ABC transporter permease [Escherichia coli]